MTAYAVVKVWEADSNHKPLQTIMFVLLAFFNFFISTFSFLASF